MTAYLVTGDSVFDARYGLLLVFNRSQAAWLEGAFNALLEYASDVDSWVTGGETTTDEAAAMFKSIWENMHPMLFLIGMIADFPVALDVDTGWLPCDGTVIAQDDYPDLFAVIGGTYDTGGEGAGNFRLPDIRG